MNSFIDVHIAASVSATELAGLLVEDGMLGTWEQDGVIHLYYDHGVWTDHMLVKIRNAIQQLGGQPDPDRIAAHVVPGQDWNAQWTASVQPIQIGRRIIIRPSWKTADIPEKGIELILDPRQAFGTGHHTTTQLLAEWIEERIQGGERVLDVGTGSGLLAMLALRFGATFALGIDHDAVAIDCAKDYAQVNQFGAELELRTLDIQALPDESFDLIIANIDRRILFAGCQSLTRVSSANTDLCLSGILVDDQQEIVAHYMKHGWCCVEVKRREDWVSVWLQREVDGLIQAGAQDNQ
ncbi:MAG: ribosomal protein L11 methyltransferase [Nitrospirales bacterium]|nr:MAG: ribosomal protein L11 methyltransferase [Nitrospirales bacterium]